MSGENFTLRLSAEEAQQLDSAAKTLDVSRAQIMRLALAGMTRAHRADAAIAGLEAELQTLRTETREQAAAALLAQRRTALLVLQVLRMPEGSRPDADAINGYLDTIFGAAP